LQLPIMPFLRQWDQNLVHCHALFTCNKAQRYPATNMDDKTALHTAARRFCQQRFSEWSQSYGELQAKEKWQVTDLFKSGWDYSDEAYRTFPRYRINGAIQVEVERFKPELTSTLDELRTELIRACDVAEARLQAELQNSIAQETLREEADDFRTYLRVLNASDLRSIEPLPYRRVINDEESKLLWKQVKETWKITGSRHWFPLQEGPDPPNVIAFHDDYFEKMNGIKMLREGLKAHGIRTVFQLQEFGPPEPEYEVELSIFVPAYGNGGEQYSTSETNDWIVYASHESSITIGGEWLTRLFKENWSEWENRTYQGPYSTADLRGTWDTK
jgi:hypothetical protein